jgi:two-component system, cell cycle response regulator DivK
VGASRFQFLPRGHQFLRFHTDCAGDSDQVRFMRFEETEQGCKQHGLACPATQVFCVDSGQVEEPLRAAFVGHSLGERGKIRLAKILIVEDNALNIKLFCDLLAAHGHEPQAVTDSRLALDAAKEFVPDLVITDIQLPHVSGLELIQLIRADETIRDVPIMAVTAYATAGDEERIRGAGAESYVTKPISVARFVQEVDSLLARKEPATADV